MGPGSPVSVKIISFGLEAALSLQLHEVASVRANQVLRDGVSVLINCRESEETLPVCVLGKGGAHRMPP